MRTTVAIDDSLLSLARKQARTRGLTLGQYLEAMIREDLARPRMNGVGPPIPVYDGETGPLPGVFITSNADLQEFQDRGLPIEKLR